MSEKIELDHLVVVAKNLEEGVAHVRQQLGVDIPKGGKHPFMGSHNHVMQLGPKAFLEVIAIDPDAKKPDHSRWFELDEFGNQTPQLKMWVARAKNLSATKAFLPQKYRRTIPMSRPTAGGIMTWDITVAEDGSLPFGGAFPTVLQWPKGPLPIEKMPDLGCELVSLKIIHPDKDGIQQGLTPIFSDSRVTLQTGATKGLTAQIQTPTGLRTLT